MRDIDVVSARDPDAWMRVLESCAPYDFYHLPTYHAAAEEAGDGSALLFAYQQNDHAIALPLLVRPIEDGATGLKDATSVYGYAGPICSRAEIPASVAVHFRDALQQRLREMGVVSVFSRLHPFHTRPALLEGLGECPVVGSTVSIDLTLPVEEQRAKIRRSHKEGINRLRRMGMTCVRDEAGAHLGDFIRLYHETMQRVGAASSYFFPTEYFDRLRAALGDRLHCFVCKLEGRVLCAGLFVACHGIVQYHLGATAGEALKLAPMKLLVDDVRVWATAQGHRIFHLGGGVSSKPDDSLFFFKHGFTDRVHDFRVWRWTLEPDTYDRLTREQSQRNDKHGLVVTSPGYFPAYRSPTVARVATPAASTPLESAPVAAGGGEP
jgi:hypothetical protein